MDQGEPSDAQARRRVHSRARVARLGAALIALALAGGSAGVMASYEDPSVSYGLEGPPWLLDLGAGMLGVLYTNHGFTSGITRSAVVFGVIDEDGTWIRRPAPVTSPSRLAPPGSLGPAGIAARFEGSRIHIALAIWDSERGDLSFHYLALDLTGVVRVATGPLANLTLEWIYGPVRLGIRVTSDEVQIAFPPNGTSNGTYLISTLDLSGVVKSPPYPAPDLDNASYFPPRLFPPGVTEMTRDSLDSDASVVSDGTTTYYLWINGRSWLEGKNTYRSERDLQFLRESPRGDVSRVLDSTADTWWLTKPVVLPSIASLVAAVSGIFVLTWYRVRHRQGKVSEGRPLSR